MVGVVAKVMGFVNRWNFNGIFLSFTQENKTSLFYFWFQSSQHANPPLELYFRVKHYVDSITLLK